MDEENPITMKSAWLYKDGKPLREIKDVESICITDESDPANQSKIDSIFIDDWNDNAQSFQINIEKDKQGYIKLTKEMIREKRKAKKKAKKDLRKFKRHFKKLKKILEKLNLESR